MLTVLIFLNLAFLLLNLINNAISLSWYKNFGTTVDDPKCIENTQPIVEYYKIDEYQYMFFSERISWDEAKTICPIYDAQLAVVDSKMKANKLAAAIGQSNIDMEDIWIGGERNEKGNWTWIDNEIIPTQSVDGYPPWVRKPDRPWKQCLAMDRFTINAPLFVDLDCRLTKPFICQREIDAPANPDVTLPSHMVKIGKSTYILYHARITWKSAAAFCRMRGYRLAIIPNNKIAKIVSTAMIKSRPSFENAWISGHFSRNDWRWLSTHESILTYPDQNNYPPWHQNSANSKNGCILLDRHTCHNPVFLVNQCDRKRDFICEKYDKKAKMVSIYEPVKIVHNHFHMILILKPLSWTDAEKYCTVMNAYLTEVYDYDMMKAIATAMSDQESEPVHIWLGGILQNSTWIWKYSQKLIPMNTDKTGFMPWCDVEDRGNNECLNMDREAQDKPAVYGLRCKLKQSFICTQVSGKLLPNAITQSTTTKTPTTVKVTTSSTRLHRKKLTNMTNATTTTTRKPTTKFKECKQKPIILTLPRGKMYVSFFTRVLIGQAESLCVQAGGELARVTSNELQALLTELRKHTIKCAARHLWIQTPDNCTYIRYDTGQAFLNKLCAKSRKGFICEIHCNHSLPQSPIFDNNIWNCSNKEKDKICSVSCKNKTILEGTDSVMCSSAGWVDAYNKTSLLPVCHDERQISTDLINWIKEFSRKNYHIVIVMDESIRVSTSQWWQELQFIASLVQITPASDSFRIGLVRYHSRAFTSIPFNVTDTCTILETLQKLQPLPNSDFPFLNLVLEEAWKQLRSLPPKDNGVIILITTGINHGGEYDAILKKLNKYKIFCIDIGDEPNEDLGTLASVMDDRFLLYKFESFQSLEHVTYRLTHHRSKELDCPERLYKLPKNSMCHQVPVSVNENGNTYVAFFTPITYLAAHSRCIDAGGVLANLSITNVDNIAITILNKTMKCPVPVIELWIDGGELPCATIEVTYESQRSHVWNCTALHGQICKISCNDHPKVSKYQKHIWDCKKSTNSYTCDIQCKDNMTIEGTDWIQCRSNQSNGWITRNGKTTYFPMCLTNNEVAKNIISLLKQLTKETDSFLFVIDKSGYDPKIWSPLLIVASIITAFPVSSDYPMGLTLFDNKTKIVIPYKATNTCLVLQELLKLKLQKSINIQASINYDNILKDVQKEISLHQPKRRAIIFFVTNRSNTDKGLTNTVKLMKERHILISIGIKSGILTDLNLLPSMYNSKLLLYKFHQYNSYNEVFKIIQRRKSSLLEC